MDINPSNTLQRESAREDKDERHICPLQLQVIERGINLWSNPGDVVYDPFGGIGSTGYVALKQGRKTIMSELKESYYKQNVLNCESATTTNAGLFD
jgi:DNA modification methylase